ncbi:L-proline trans-4-hydroxylase-like [Mytilus galloprovincialis]|uniref:L-proline trans-4-hydroxylase-like n=1 Tax=Mytilus galloprovincialis TaxID=29158 RepID=UPI003F7C9829
MSRECDLNGVYQFNGDTFQVTPEVKTDFEKYGYIVIRNVLDATEVEKLIKEFKDPSTSELLNNNKVQVSDCQGREAKLTIWGHPGNDVSGMVSRSEKVAGTCQQLLGDEVYHYHGKLVTKEPFTGGAHLWHQDYGYWYINEFLEPNMMTVFIALDKCEKTNGCLQIIEGSHKCGRLDHKLEGQLTVSDPSRLDKIMDRFPMKYCLLNPGDALFFHCNLLHCSGQNSSANRRWALLTAYNTVSNQSCKPHHHPQYQRLEKVPNTAIKSCDKFTDFADKRILVPKTLDSKQVIKKTTT